MLNTPLVNTLKTLQSIKSYCQDVQDRLDNNLMSLQHIKSTPEFEGFTTHCQRFNQESIEVCGKVEAKLLEIENLISNHITPENLKPLL